MRLGGTPNYPKTRAGPRSESGPSALDAAMTFLQSRFSIETFAAGGKHHRPRGHGEGPNEREALGGAEVEVVRIGFLVVGVQVTGGDIPMGRRSHRERYTGEGLLGECALRVVV